MNQAAADAHFSYIGSELELFEKARNWKAYWTSQIRSYVTGDVLEVGSGIGANTRLMAGFGYRRWVCLEPDPSLIRKMGSAPSERHQIVTGVVEDLPSGERFDTILYIDVLEHIEDDGAEMARAAGRLRAGGALVVLSPAHPFLFTPFDAAIGHYRRYTRGSLRAVGPPELACVKLDYLDAAGMLASAANRFLLRSAMPTAQQILTWDRLLVPVSRCVDPLLGRRLGKSVLGIWRREGAAAHVER